MGWFDRFRSKAESSGPSVRPGVGPVFSSLDNSADLDAYIRGVDTETVSGAIVNAESAMMNTAVNRCVSLIAESIAMLPLNLIENGDQREYASEHAVHRLLKHRPNNYQTPYKFKSTMQAQVLIHGNAYARVVRSGSRIIGLIPLHPTCVVPELRADYSGIEYHVQLKNRPSFTLQPADVLHLSDLSIDGVSGMSRVRQAKETIGLALEAERAAARIFKSGVMAGGALSLPGKLSPAQVANISESLEANYGGSTKAHKWMILEEGAKAEKWSNNARESQHIENRNHQVEEIARTFGVPRPLLMMDDTSWGSGIEQLGIFFVQYGLQHWFTVWEQAIEHTLLTDADRRNYHVKFNERALLRGTLKDQADFFTKALGSGGHSPWLSQNEVRELQELARSDAPEADKLESPITRKQTDEPS